MPADKFDIAAMPRRQRTWAKPGSLSFTWMKKWAKSAQELEQLQPSDEEAQPFDSEEKITVALQRELPDWFLDNCVEPFHEIQASDIPLVIRSSKSSSQAKKSSDGDTEPTNQYEIDSVFYGGLSVLIPQSPTTSALGTFTHDAAVLRTPVLKQQSAEGFLRAALRRFARDQKASIMTLFLSDLNELCNSYLSALFEAAKSHLAETSSVVSKAQSSSSHTEDDVETSSANKSDKSSSLHSKLTDFQIMAHKLLFSKLIKAADLKVLNKNNKGDTQQHSGRLIIVLPELRSMLSRTEHEDILAGLKQAVEFTNLSHSRVILVGLDSWDAAAGSRAYYDLDFMINPNQLQGIFDDDNLVTGNHNSRGNRAVESTSILSLLGTNPLHPVQPLLATATDAQTKLFHEQWRATGRRNNIHALRMGIRKRLGADSQHKLLEPYASWDIPEDSHCFRMLSSSRLDPSTVAYIAASISTNVSMDQILGAFEALDTIQRRIKPEKPQHAEEERWSKYHKAGQEAIARIMKDPYKYQWENTLLDRLVDQDDVKHGWGDIELEDNEKQTIKQLVDLANSDPTSQTGILRNSRINGALLYGPPGTGKTHLARVLAHEYSAIMIHVSAAELEHKYVGETEKAIKATFNLGTMLYPSIIFIDEADSLFRKRHSEDGTYTRDRLNALLTQTDGLVKSKKQPFLLLATNNPGDLDEAVLRRVPGRLYIGLPSERARANLLALFLGGETVDADVQLKEIAALTGGFSGSDLHTLCVQTALVSEAEAKVPNQRVLKRGHFNVALSRCGTTVSDSAMGSIREFARKFDPSTADKISSKIETRGGTTPRLKDRARKPAMGYTSSPHQKNGTRPLVNGTADHKAYEDWKKSDAYPYVTEELLQSWWEKVPQ